MKKRIVAVVGLGFGDEGKGSIVDALARSSGAEAVVRYSGGPQAAHHVVTSEGVMHCFSQLGAGTLAGAGVETWLGPHMMVDPPALLREAEALENIGVRGALARVTVDERCVVVTPFHRLMNRIEETARGAARHGSCGRGVGQAYVDSLNPSLPSVRMGDLRDIEGLRAKLRFLQLVKLDRAEQIAEAHPEISELPSLVAALGSDEWIDTILDQYRAVAARVRAIDDGNRLLARLREPGRGVIFEGAQGVLLDEHRGFWPHVTPGRTGFDYADELCAEAGIEPPYRIGVLRAYTTRHGAGPLVGEDAALAARLPETHNIDNPWQGPMRAAWFDCVLARYALDCAGGVDGIALTCLDRIAALGDARIATAWACDDIDVTAAAEGFDIGGGVVRRIRVAAATNRDHQQRLGVQLARFRPVLAAVAPDCEAITASIEESLATPITILSIGPTAAAKSLRLPSL